MFKAKENIFDNLDISEVDSILGLDKYTDFDVDENTLCNIKNLVHKRINSKSSRKSIYKKLISIAAAFIVIFSTLFVIGSGDITQAFNKIFSFIPGIGIVDNNKDILFSILKPTLSETNDYILEINNAVATKNTISVFITLNRKVTSNEHLKKDKEKEWQGLVGQISKINLYINNKKYKIQNFVTGDGLNGFQAYLTFSVGDTSINTSAEYKLGIDNYNISCDFSLIDVKNYNSPDEVGPTEEHNNISLTAIAKLTNGSLKVNIYPINNTDYRIIGYSGKYFGDDLLLNTNKGNKEYNLKGFDQTYSFDVSDGAEKFILKIPYIIAESVESKIVSLPVPNVGESEAINKTINFNDGNIKIKAIEKVNVSGNDILRIELDYDNFRNNKLFTSIHFSQVDFWGNDLGSSYSGEMNENMVLKYVYLDLKKNVNSVKLKLYNPQFILADDYNIKLDAK